MFRPVLWFVAPRRKQIALAGRLKFGGTLTFFYLVRTPTLLQLMLISKQMSSGCRPGQQGGECNLCGVSCGAGLGGYEPHACHGGRAGGPVRACADVFPGAGAEQTPGSSISAPQAQRLSHFLDFSFTYFTATHSDNYFCFLCAFLCWAPFNPGNNLLGK